jgi:hypothetical protein
MNVIRTTLSVSKLKRGDTVEVDGQLITVGEHMLKHCNFMGWTFNGAPYRQGITRVVFKVPTAFGYRYE